MLRVRTGRASQVLRITVAALLFLSCTRIVRPLASWSADKSSALATRCMQVARSSVLEVGGGGAKLVVERGELSRQRLDARMHRQQSARLGAQQQRNRTSLCGRRF